MSAHEPTPIDAAELQALVDRLAGIVDDLLSELVQTRELLAAQRDEAGSP